MGAFFLWSCHDGFYLLQKSIARPFIGIEIEHPIIATCVLRKTFLLAIAMPRVRKNTHAIGTGDVDRLVCRASIHNKHVISPITELAERPVNPVLFIIGDNKA